MVRGGEIGPASRRTRFSSSDGPSRDDRLSALPADVLVLILRHLRTAAAARTSLLSRRWRRVWSLLPDLCFPYTRDPRLVVGALAAHQVSLRSVSIGTLNAASKSVADLLHAAARRLSGGRLAFQNAVPLDVATSRRDRGSLELPVFEHVTALSLDLGFLGLSVAAAGTFARLTELSLIWVQFREPYPCDLGDAVSSSRCPCLQKLAILQAWRLDALTIFSESLRQLELLAVRDLRRLTVVAPALKDLSVTWCFSLNKYRRPAANISAPQLELLHWHDNFDPSYTQLGKMEHLQSLSVGFIACGPEGTVINPSCVMLLSRFKVVERLVLTLFFALDLGSGGYLMEGMSTLPCIKCLDLRVIARGHAFGASSFHVLRMCTGITRLVLLLQTPTHNMAKAACSSSGCICNLPQNWKTEKLLLDHLEEVEIRQFSGSEHEVSFVKRLLFEWAPVLKKVTVTFDPLAVESKVEESLQMLQSHSRPEICNHFYIYKDFIEVLYAPKAKAPST